MSQVSLPITSRTASDDNLFSDVYGNDLAIANVLNGGLDEGNFTGGQLPLTGIPAGSIGDDKLTSPNNLIYRRLLTVNAFFASPFTGGAVYLPGTFDATTQDLPATDATALDGSQGVAPMWRYSATYLQPIAGKTLTLNLLASYISNNINSGVTFTAGLYPVSIASAAGKVGVNTGVVIASSTAAFSPGASGNSAAAAAGFLSSFLANGTNYVIGVEVSGGMAANAAVSMTIQLLANYT